MLEYNQIMDHVSDRIDLAGRVSDGLKDDRKFFMDQVSEFNHMNLIMWSNGIINYDEYKIIRDHIEECLIRTLERY